MGGWALKLSRKTKKTEVNMKNLFKRSQSLILAVIMLLGILPMAPLFIASADDPYLGVINTDPSLVAWYTFEEETFTKVGMPTQLIDASGNGNHATMFTPGNFVQGAIGIDGASLNFNNGNITADGAYLELPSDVIKGTDSYTVSGWIKLTASRANAAMFSFFVPGAATAAYTTYSPLAANSSGIIRMGGAGIDRHDRTVVGNHNVGGDGPNVATMPFSGVNVGEWVHIAVTRDSKATRIYKNGSLFAIGPAGASFEGQDITAYLGRSNNSAHSFFDGEMDDIRVYERALPAEHVMELYRGYDFIADMDTTPGYYLMTYNLPEGFSANGSDTAALSSDSRNQMGMFDYSVHYAYSLDGKTWTPLYDNRGILYWRDNGAWNATSHRRPVQPRIVLQDGVYNLYANSVSYQNATQTGTTARLRWTSSDLINWTQVGTLSADAAVTDVGAGGIPALPPGVNVDITSKPYKANVGNVIAVTEAQLRAIRDAYEAPAFDVVEKTIMAGDTPDLPNYATITVPDGAFEGGVYNYGHSVTWDERYVDYDTPGTYEVVGTLNYDYNNIITRNGADPQISFYDIDGDGPDPGWYYYTSSWMDDSISSTWTSWTNATSQSARTQYMGVTLRRARTIAELQTMQTAAESRDAGFYPYNQASDERMIFWKGEIPGVQSALGNYTRGSAHIWAPEFHRVSVGGVTAWAVYWAGSPIYAGTSGTTEGRWNIRKMVSVNYGPDPFEGEWTTTDLDTLRPSGNFDLDGSILEHNGRTFMVLASNRQTNSRNWIVEMQTPTQVNAASGAVMLMEPLYTFENRNDRVLEGATFLKANGRIWKSHSVGSTNANYSMGLGWAVDSPSTDVMNPASWNRFPHPIMHANRSSDKWGPGHAAFDYDHHGSGGIYPILTYHARRDEGYGTGHNPGPLYSPTRQANIAPVYFLRNGTPYVGIPPADGEIPAMPIYATITVLSSDEIRLDVDNATFSPAVTGYGEANLTAKEFTVTNPAASETTVAISLSNANFTLSANSLTVPADGTATFTVTPVLGLAAGVYTVTVTVTDGTAVRTVTLSFSVLDAVSGYFVDSYFDAFALTPNAPSATTTYITNLDHSTTLSGKVYQALYDPAGKMVSSVSEPFAVAPGQTVIAKTTLTLPAAVTDAYTVKCFVWDDNFIPMADAVEFAGNPTTSLLPPHLQSLGTDFTVNLAADFDFEDLTTTSTTLSGGNAIATVNGTPSVQTASSTGGLPTNGGATAANFPTSGAPYYRVTKADGTPLLTGAEGMIVSYSSRTTQTGTTFRWPFFAKYSTANNSETNLGYIGANDRSNNLTLERFDRSSRSQSTSRTISNTGWKNVDFVVLPTSSSIYMNGTRQGADNTSGLVPLTTILGNNSIFQIGRANWGTNGEYFIGQIDNFKIFTLMPRTEKTTLIPAALASDWTALSLSQASGAQLTANLNALPTRGANGSTITWGTTNPIYLTATGQVRRPGEADGNQTAVLLATLTAPTGEIVTKAFIYTITAVSDAGAVQEDTAGLKVLADLAAGPTEILLSDFEADAILPAFGVSGSSISWVISDPTVMSADGKNLVTGIDKKPVTLTATVSKGAFSETKTFELICKTPYYGYLLSYFIGNAGAQQQFFLATSPDSDQWTWLNNNTRMINLTGIGEAAARDPFIIKHPHTDKYYMLATDLNSNKSSEVTGWRTAYGYPSTFNNTWGNKAILAYESTDLINWTLSSRTDFTDSGHPENYYTRLFSNSWAPEAIWVEDHDNGDGTTGAFMMFWSGSVDNNRSGNTDFNHAVAAFTKDFSQGSFSPPQALYNIVARADMTGTPTATQSNQQLIDGTIVWDPFAANGEGRWHMYFRLGPNSLSRTERVTSVSTKIPSTTAEWTNRTRIIDQAGWEGACFHKMIGQNEWRMIIDGFGSPSRFAMFRTYDFVTHTEITSQSNIGMGLPGAGGRVRHGTIIPIPRDRYEELVTMAPAGSWAGKNGL